MASPWVLVPPLGIGMVTGQSWVNIVQMFCLGQGVRVTFCCRWLDAAKANGEFSQRLGRFANRPYRGGESRLGGGVRLQEGWIPASAGKTDGGWRCGAVPARPFDPPQRTYSKLRVSGPSQGWIHGIGASSIGGWHACRRLRAGMTGGRVDSGPHPRRPPVAPTGEG